MRVDDAETERIIAVNLTSAITSIRALLPNLRKSTGAKVIFIGSTSGLDNSSGREVAYAASKFGLRGASHALRENLRADDIAVTCLNPGNIGTITVEGVAPLPSPPDSTLSGGGCYVASIANRRTASEGITVMITSQLLFEFFGRLAPSRYLHRPEDRPESVLRRLRSILDRRSRQHSPPPYFSDHLCRPIVKCVVGLSNASCIKEIEVMAMTDRV